MSVLIVGAGMAGLAAAIDLAAAGEQVTLVERAPAPGGKMREAEVDGRPVDAGPTVLTLAPVFEQLFADAGARLDDAVRLTPADILARHVWPDGSRLDLFADEDCTAEAIATFAGPADARGYRAFAAAGRAIHDALRRTFMEADKPANPLSLMMRGGLAGMAGFTRLDPYRPLSAMVAEHMRDPRLRQLFGRYATYCGSSPFRAPATLALVAHVERAGVWLVDGGMARLADAMLALATRLGVTRRFGAHVEAITIDRGRAAGLRLTGGERLAGDRILLTADAAALAAGCFGAAAAKGSAAFRREDRSLSAFTVALTAETGGVPLVRHTIVFSGDARAEFDALAGGRMPGDPTVYVCAQDRAARDGPPAAARERMLLVLNAPADGDIHTYSEAEIERCMTRAFTRLSASGLNVAVDRRRCSISTPSDFERRFPATGGALYGRASHGWMASFRRPGATTPIPGLFCAGGSVHPGAGVPMAALSGRAAARAILRSLPAARASISRSPRAAMPGGMSTRSATTAGTA